MKDEDGVMQEEILKILNKLFFVTCQDQTDRLDKAAKEIIEKLNSIKNNL